MDSFKIFETDQFLADMDQDFGGRQQRLKDKLHHSVYPQLRLQPYFGRNIKKLKDYTPATWRYRIGDYRFFYTVDDRKKTVFMLAIDHRSEAY